jgi:hypothetical protein
MFRSQFTAYFDASGNRDTSAISMAGFVSRLNKWERFEVEWRALLPPGIPMFHMTDFVNSRKGWESWRRAPGRGPLFDRLIACIKKNTNKGFGVSLRLSDYFNADSQFQLQEAAGSAYALVGCACLEEVHKWAVRRDVDYRSILCVFEDGDLGRGTLIRRARADGFNAILQSKQNVRAFDACDLVAWKTRRLVDDALVSQSQDQDSEAAEHILKAMDLLNPILHLNGFIDRELLAKLCDVLNLGPRQGADAQNGSYRPPQAE